MGGCLSVDPDEDVFERRRRASSQEALLRRRREQRAASEAGSFEEKGELTKRLVVPMNLLELRFNETQGLEEIPGFGNKEFAEFKKSLLSFFSKVSESLKVIEESQQASASKWGNRGSRIERIEPALSNELKLRNQLRTKMARSFDSAVAAAQNLCEAKNEEIETGGGQVFFNFEGERDKVVAARLIVVIPVWKSK